MKIPSFKEIFSGNLKVFIFNVGQGDHTLILLPNNELGIIDCHYSNSLGHTELPVITFIRRLRDLKIIDQKEQIIFKFLCITHPDNDHIRGLNQLLDFIDRDENITVENIWWYKGFKIGELLKEFNRTFQMIYESKSVHPISSLNMGRERKGNLRAIQEYRKRYPNLFEEISNIRLINGNLGKGVKAYSMGPLDLHFDSFLDPILNALKKINESNVKVDTKTKDKEKREYYDISLDKNLLSSLLKIVYKDFELLFGGDVHKKIWHDCLNEYEAKNMANDIPSYHSNLIKISHHGSHNSSSPEIWNNLLDSNYKNPQNLVFSAGFHKKYNHPRPETITQIKEASLKEGVKVSLFSTNACDPCNEIIQKEVDLNWLFTPKEKNKG